MEDFSTVVKTYLDLGMTALLAVVLIVSLIMLISKLPKMVEKFQTDAKKDRVESEQKYQAQLQIVIALQQQSLEQQRLATTVIERNNTIIQGCIDGYERLGTKMDNLAAQSCRTELATKENREIAHKAHEEAIKVNERLKRNHNE